MAFSKKVQDYIKKYKKKSQSDSDFLTDIIHSPHKRNFVKTLLLDRAHHIQNIQHIESCFSNHTDFINWYYHYQYVYHSVFNTLWKKSQIQDCVKMIPSIAPWAFADKKQPEIGQIPKDWTREEFFSLLDLILSSSLAKGFNDIKDSLYQSNPMENNKSEFKNNKKISALMKQNLDKENKIDLFGKVYSIKPFYNPMSSKMVFQITTPKKNKYILKISNHNILNPKNDRDKKIKEALMLRADSPFQNAMADFYLKFNLAQSAASILYYNFDYDAVLYKKDDTRQFKFPKRLKKSKNPLLIQKEIVPDLNGLGIYLNDVHEKNFLINKKTGYIQLIDAGHISYSNLLNAGVPGLTITIPNFCGNDVVSHFGELNVCKA